MKLIGRFKKIFSIGIAIVLLACTLTACIFNGFTGYKGEFPELYTVAVNSLLGTVGYHSHGDALIEIIEEDSFGRQLFSYYENSYLDEGWPNCFSYLICQKIDETHVYYYPDYNFISKEWNGLDAPFSNEEIEDLKIRNNWGEDFNEEEFIKAEIVLIRNQPEVEIEEEVFYVLFQKIATGRVDPAEGTKVSPYVLFLTSDTYGRTLYYAAVSGKINREDVEIHVAMIFNPDGSYNEEICVMELMDLYNYQDDLKEFKELNNWNRPLE